MDIMKSGTHQNPGSSGNTGTESPRSAQVKKRLWTSINSDRVGNDDHQHDLGASDGSTNIYFDGTNGEFVNQHANEYKGNPGINRNNVGLLRQRRTKNKYDDNNGGSLKTKPAGRRILDWRSGESYLTAPKTHHGLRKGTVADPFESSSSERVAELHSRDAEMLDDVFVLHANRNSNYKFGDPFESCSDSITTINSFPPDSPGISYSNAKNTHSDPSEPDDTTFVTKVKLILKRVGTKIKKCFCVVSTKSKEYITRLCDKRKQRAAEKNRKKNEQNQTKEPLLGPKRKVKAGKKPSKHSKNENTSRISIPFSASSSSLSDFETTKNDKDKPGRFADFKSRSKSRFKNKNKKTSNVPHVTLSPFPGD